MAVVLLIHWCKTVSIWLCRPTRNSCDRSRESDNTELDAARS